MNPTVATRLHGCGLAILDDLVGLHKYMASPSSRADYQRLWVRIRDRGNVMGFHDLERAGHGSEPFRCARINLHTPPNERWYLRYFTRLQAALGVSDPGAFPDVARPVFLMKALLCMCNMVLWDCAEDARLYVADSRKSSGRSQYTAGATSRLERQLGQLYLVVQGILQVMVAFDPNHRWFREHLKPLFKQIEDVAKGSSAMQVSDEFCQRAARPANTEDYVHVPDSDDPWWQDPAVDEYFEELYRQRKAQEQAWDNNIHREEYYQALEQHIREENEKHDPDSEWLLDNMDAPYTHNPEDQPVVNWLLRASSAPETPNTRRWLNDPQVQGLLQQIAAPHSQSG